MIQCFRLSCLTAVIQKNRLKLMSSPAGGGPSGTPDGRRNRGMLASYYGLAAMSSGNSPEHVESQGDAPSGSQVPGEQDSADPCDLDSASFSPELYLNKIMKEKSLTELMDTEHEMVRQIRLLDNDMQTLVYENYNKFISATDTIKKMKTDFHKMEEEMSELRDSMAAIGRHSQSIDQSLHSGRDQIQKLSSVHRMLKKLKLLFELPSRISNCIDVRAYNQAVRYYTKSSKILEKYEHISSFRAIREECDEIIVGLVSKLEMQLGERSASPRQLSQSVELLLELGQSPSKLCAQYLLHAQEKLDGDLAQLTSQVKRIVPRAISPVSPQGESDDKSSSPGSVTESQANDVTNNPSSPSAAAEDKGASPKRTIANEDASGLYIDVLEYVDIGCNGFVTNISLVISTYQNLFMKTSSGDVLVEMTNQLNEFAQSNLERYIDLIRQRVEFEVELGSTVFLVRALDRFYRRIVPLDKLISSLSVGKKSLALICHAGKAMCNRYSTILQQSFLDGVLTLRQQIVQQQQSHSPKSVSAAVGSNASTATLSGDRLSSGRDATSSPSGGILTLSDMLAALEQNIVEKLKAVLTTLHSFAAPDITFACRPEFSEEFSKKDVREGVVVRFIKFVLQHAQELSERMEQKTVSQSPTILAVMSRLCLDYNQMSISYMLSIADEQFRIKDKTSLTPVAELASLAHKTANKIVTHFVKVQGLHISQMIRKSVETRDWINTIEPRTVRAVMKRVVEDITRVDKYVGQLYEEGKRKERSSDSGRRSYSRFGGGNMSTFSPSSGAGGRGRGAYSQGNSNTGNFNTSLITNIQKLFSEKVDVFMAVEFNRVSIMTGIVKICLKTLLECVRMRTFGKFGLQQMQVDCAYLQNFLERFVSDEVIVTCLLEEAVTSSAHRCLDPVPMEPSVIELICERG
ncbi:vacuolar protein sorting-associated protein 51 homolog isoform X2 [Convolutriloba macropyga]|uniref:vacuolar protein sorting-associated protein 51 homolog isoform X2 n=1 Tax=Convolutriloba macropyga TaxID=536237 RepID=UPI003F527A3B